MNADHRDQATPQPSLDDRRLSVEDCRRLIGSSARDLSDAQVERLRNEMYDLASCVVGACNEDRAIGERGTLDLIPEEDRDGVEERAAVLQFDANMPRSVATRTACASYLRSSRDRPPSNR